MKWIGLVAAIALVISCFMPWVFIESKNITVSGVEAIGTNFGKPGYFHFVLTAIFLALTFIAKIWAKRTNLLVTALNLGWAVRNYFVIAACQGGDCPEKQAAIYIMLIASILMLVTAMFPDMKATSLKK